MRLTFSRVALIEAGLVAWIAWAAAALAVAQCGSGDGGMEGMEHRLFPAVRSHDC